MNKYTKLQQAVDRVKATLPVGPDGEVYCVSLENDQKGTIAGRVGVNTAHVAALLIAQGTHAVASPDQIATWKEDQARKKADSEALASKKENKVNVDLGSFLQQFMAMTALAAQAPAPKESEAPASKEAASSGKRHTPQIPVPPTA